MKNTLKTICLGLILTSSVWAIPTGGVVDSNGTVSIKSTTGNAGPGIVSITQSTPTAIISWGSYSLAAGELVTYYNNSGPGGAVLNRVVGGSSSDIEGTIASNETVYLINQNGILIGSTGVISATGFVASTRDILNTSFYNGTYHFTGTGKNGVVNLGVIKATGGDVVLIGKNVDNENSIKATGRIGLVAANDVLLGQTNSDGSTIVVKTLGTPPTVGGTGVSNSGTLSATAAELKVANGNIYALAIDNQGTIRASNAKTEGGHIYLTTNSGQINTGNLNAGLGAGKGATPGTININGSTININGAVIAQKGILTLNATGTITPVSGGSVNVGSFILQGGNWMEVVGQNGLTALTAFNATSDFEIQNNSTFLRAAGGDGSLANSYQLTDIYGLQGVNTYLSSNFVLNNNINAIGTKTWNSLTGFNPLGKTVGFSGTFNGQGHVISGLTMNSTQNNAGLFGYTHGATIEDLGLVLTNIAGGTNVGSLVGNALNTNILNSYATGLVKGQSSIGGLAGFTSGSTLTDNYSLATVSGTSQVGGVAGVSQNSTLTSNYWILDKNINLTLTGVGGYTANGTTFTTGDNVGASPETYKLLRLQSTYSGWDFTSTWSINPKLNGDLPFLQIHP